MWPTFHLHVSLLSTRKPRMPISRPASGPSFFEGLFCTHTHTHICMCMNVLHTIMREWDFGKDWNSPDCSGGKQKRRCEHILEKGRSGRSVESVCSYMRETKRFEVKEALRPTTSVHV